MQWQSSKCFTKLTLKVTIFTYFPTFARFGGIYQRKKRFPSEKRLMLNY